MASSKTSKTARASMSAGMRSTGSTFDRAGGTNRFMTTGGGQWAYVLTNEGGTKHMRVGSAEFVSTVAAMLASRDGARVAAEIAENEARFPGRGWAASMPADEIPAAA